MKQMITRLLHYKRMTAIVVFFLIMQSIVELLLPTLLAVMIDRGVVNQDLSYIIRIGFIMLGIAALGGISTVISSYYSAKIGLGISYQIREDLFKKATRFSLHEFNAIGTSSLITRTTNDVIQVQNFLIFALRMFIRAPIMALGGIILAISVDLSLSLVLAVAVIFLVVLIISITRRTTVLYKKMQERIDDLNLLLRERITGIRVLRAFIREDDQLDKFKENNQDLTETAITINRIMAVMMPSMMLIMSFSTVAILWFGAMRVEAGAMMVGNLIAFIQYAMLILFSFIMITVIFIMYPRASVSAERINEVIGLDFEITDAEEAADIDAIESIEYEQVSFRYSPESEEVLKDVSFTVSKGQKIGIIGGTGSGKTSLLHLLLRFYEPVSGEVRINGIPLPEISQKSLRAQIGYVPQDSFVLSGTIADNISFACEALSKEEMAEVAAAAQLESFINEQEKGYQAEVYQSGKNLSGGQKQRLNMARAFAKNPSVYLFDDSFSALDYKTDYLIRKKIQEDTREAIVIMVAQRVTTIMDADLILVLHKGEIAGAGTHKELLEESKIYREIVYSQLTEEEVS